MPKNGMRPVHPGDFAGGLHQAAYELRVAEIENGKAIAKEIQPFSLAA